MLKLERIPLEVLVLLLEHPGELVTREQIVTRVWGNSVFLDTDNSIRGAIRKIRKVLKDDPEHPNYIQTITGQGYRLIAPVVSMPKTTAEAGSEQNASRVEGSDRDFVSQLDDWLQARKLRVVQQEEQGQTPKQATQANPTHRSRSWSIRKRIMLTAAASLAFIGLLSLLIPRTWLAKPTGPSRKIVLAVLPFDNLSHDPDQDFLGDGLTEDMIIQVGKINRDRLAVVARSTVAKYKGSKLAPKEIGRQLSADYLLEGSVQRWSDRIRITVQLIEVGDQTDVWAESYDRELKDVPAVQDSVVRSIAGQIHIALTGNQQLRPASQHETRPETYEAYLKGRYYWNKRTGAGMEKAAQYFQQAIDGDPGYAAAYSGLADCNSGLAWHGFRSPAEVLPRAYAAARKAIEIDPQSAQAHASLGLVLSHRWEWAEAEVEFKRALELDSQYANAHHWYGDYFSMRGRHEEALAEAKRALELDPLNLMISTWVGLRYYLARDYTNAIAQNRTSVELDPNFAAAHLVLGEDYLQAGMQKEAVDEFKKGASLSENSPLYTAQVAVGLAASPGKRRDALRIAGDLEMISGKHYVSPYGLARVYAALNDKDQTFKWLQAAYDDHAVWLGYLAVDPIFDRYRSDERFQNLLRRVGLP